MRKKFKSVFYFLFFLFLSSPGYGIEQNIFTYTANPGVLPNVLLMLDTSQSMNCQAYAEDSYVAGNGDETLDTYQVINASTTPELVPTMTYYGYFNSKSRYCYVKGNKGQGLFVEEGADKCPVGNGKWSGNFLNWLTMRRVDILRKVLVGGKVLKRTWAFGEDDTADPNNPGSDKNGPKVLLGHITRKRGRGRIERGCYDYSKYDNKRPGETEIGVGGKNGESPYNPDITKVALSIEQCKKDAPCIYHLVEGRIEIELQNDSKPAVFEIRVENRTKSDYDFVRGAVYGDPVGVIQTLSNSFRFGLELANASRGGKIISYIGESCKDPVTGKITTEKINCSGSIVEKIENMPTDTYTPLAEMLYEGVNYFRQFDFTKGGRAYQTAYLNGDYVVANYKDDAEGFCESSAVTGYKNCDPFYYSNYSKTAWCANCSIVIIGDGMPFYDGEIPNPDSATGFDGGLQKFSPVVGLPPDVGKDLATFDGINIYVMKNKSNLGESCVSPGDNCVDADKTTNNKISDQIDDVALWAHNPGKGFKCETSVNGECTSWSNLKEKDAMAKDCELGDIRTNLSGNVDKDPDLTNFDLPFNQNISIYTVRTWGEDQPGSSMLITKNAVSGKQELLPANKSGVLFSLFNAAKNGGYVENDKNWGPTDASEWDSDGNGIPDTYFEASSSENLAINLTMAFQSVLSRSSSESNATVVSSQGEGEGIAAHAMYKQREYSSDFKKHVTWIGYLYGFWLDAYGNLREDTVPDGKLVLKEDKIIKFNEISNTENINNCSKINGGQDLTFSRYTDTKGDGKTFTIDVTTDPLTVNDINFLWEGSNLLSKPKFEDTDVDTRKVYTKLNSKESGIPDSFDSSKNSEIRPYLALNENTSINNNDAGAADLINFIRGKEIPGFRNRTITKKVGNANIDKTFRLGDISHSGPTVYGAPNKNFDLMYKDKTYAAFYKRYGTYGTRPQDRPDNSAEEGYIGPHVGRPTMVYVGANDGMLHAFSLGFYHKGDNPTDIPTNTDTDVEQGWFTSKADGGSNPFPTGCSHNPPIEICARELWSFIPKNLLPHLKWLADPNYTHIYYVDLTPQIFEFKFSEPTGTEGTSTYDSGWRSILIGGMRFGGGPMTQIVNNTETNFRSAYFALDVTDPTNPKFLWEFEHPELGFTTALPAVIRTGADGTQPTSLGSWRVIFGSGPGWENIPSDKNKQNNTLNNSMIPIDAIKNIFNGGISHQKISFFVLDLYTGKLLENNDTNNDGYSDPIHPGLSSDFFGFAGDPSGIDIDIDGKVDVIYFGTNYYEVNADLKPLDSIKFAIPQPTAWDGPITWKGNLFRIAPNNSPDNPSTWNLSTFFSGLRPISGAANASIDFKYNLWVYFGTGRFFSLLDKKSSYTEAQMVQLQDSLYGIKDPCWKPSDAGTSGLNDQTGTDLFSSCNDTVNNADITDATSTKVFQSKKCLGGEQEGLDCSTNEDCPMPIVGNNPRTYSVCMISGGGITGGGALTSWNALIENAKTNAGWRLDFSDNNGTLKPQETSFTQPQIVGGIVFATTFAPNRDICELGGTAKLYAPYFTTGTAYRNDVIGTDSNITDSEKGTLILRSSSLGSGIPSAPSIHRGREKGVMVYTGMSSGVLAQKNADPAFDLKTHAIFWKEDFGF